MTFPNDVLGMTFHYTQTHNKQNCYAIMHVCIYVSACLCSLRVVCIRIRIDINRACTKCTTKYEYARHRLRPYLDDYNMSMIYNVITFMSYMVAG